MNRLIIATGVLAATLVGLQSASLAQNRGDPAIEANATGSCVTSPRGGNAGGWLISCGDIGPGSGMLVVRPPEARPPASSSAPEPVAVVPDGGAPVDASAAPDGAVATPADQDADNIADDQEANLGLDPANPDTDEDGLADGDEVSIYLTDPINWDTDGDSLGDGQEMFATGTDPLVWNDATASNSQSMAQQAAQPEEGVLLEQETTEVLTADDGRAAALGTGNASASPGSVTRGGVSTGTSLLGPDGSYSVSEVSPPVVNVSGATSQPPSVVPAASAPAVTDATTPTETVVTDVNTSATATDADGDNYADSLEWEIGLDSNNPDTDADGVADGDEITIYLTDPFAWDTDGDGIADGEELFGIQTDPLAWDTDGDGLGDGQAVTGA